MNDLEKELRSLGPLAASGQLVKLRKRMLNLWSVDNYWESHDVALLATLLKATKNLNGDKASGVYKAFASRIKSHSNELAWLESLPSRADIVATYEGSDQAAAWLETLHPQITPPNDGIVDLILGGFWMFRGDFQAARQYLRKAVDRSMSGIEWYRLEALSSMFACLTKLGENRLAFEYARSHAIESYKLNLTDENKFYDAIYGLSLFFGQMDYLVEVQKILAQKMRQAGNFTYAAMYASNAGLRLAWSGAAEEAARELKQAEEDAQMGSHPDDPYFSLTCGFLAQYVNRSPVTDRDLVDDLKDVAAGFAFSTRELMLVEVSLDLVRTGRVLTDRLLGEWRTVCRAYPDAPAKSSPLLFIHLAALLGQFYLARGYVQVAEALFEAIVGCQGCKDAIFLFVRKDYIELLLENKQYQKAMEVCAPALEWPVMVIDERFAFRQLMARINLALGQKQYAYHYASLALSDWKRVLDGFYSENHKVAWLQNGLDCISCAIAAIQEPVDWMPEDQRCNEFFELVELGKARLATDMVCHTGHLPGVFLLPDLMDKHRDFVEVIMSEHPDWLTPVLLQSAASSDIMTTVIHNDDRSVVETVQLDPAVLRTVIQLPLSPDRQLYATAEALGFEKARDTIGDDLYADMMKVPQSIDGQDDEMDNEP